MSEEVDAPVTLGDKLKLQRGRQSSAFLDRKSMELSDKQSFRFPRILFIPPIIGLLSWWASTSPVIGIGVMSLGILYSTLVYFDKAKQNIAKKDKTRLVSKLSKVIKVGKVSKVSNNNFLISHDKQGFMKSLKLSDKTVIFDGNNIYHFGMDNGIGTKALETLVRELRAEGFRIVCFFDANIYYTMRDNSVFQNINKEFSVAILQTIFGLRKSEIYVVPSSVRADDYIIASLSLLPISFAVTNDRFRDYEAKYDFLVKDKQWRKGVKIKGGKLLLYQHKFKQPLIM